MERTKSEIVLDIANKKRNTPPVLREAGDGDCNHDSYGPSELLLQRGSSGSQERSHSHPFPRRPDPTGQRTRCPATTRVPARTRRHSPSRLLLPARRRQARHGVLPFPRTLNLEPFYFRPCAVCLDGEPLSWL